MLPGVFEFSTFLYWQGIIDVITTWTCWCFSIWCLILLNQSTSLLFPFSLITIFFKIPYFLWHQVSNSHIWLLHSILNRTFHYSYLFIFAAFVSSFSFSSSINVFTFLFIIWYFLSIRSMSVFLLSFPFFFCSKYSIFFSDNLYILFHPSFPSWFLVWLFFIFLYASLLHYVFANRIHKIVSFSYSTAGNITQDFLSFIYLIFLLLVDNSLPSDLFAFPHQI